MTIEASSDDSTLVPAEGLVVEGEGAERSLHVTPTPLGLGPVRITLGVRDSAGLEASATFILEVVLPFEAQFPKLTSGYAAALDHFGSSVAVSGDYAIVGAYGDDDGGSSSGSAYAYRRSGDTWTEIAKLTASDAAADDLFGLSVAIRGDYAIVSARADDDLGDGSGSAYVFARSGDVWTEIAKLTASDAMAGEFFGNSLAMDGDFAIIGIHRDECCSTNSGAAYVFRRSGANWTEVSKLTASDGAARDVFGISVGISGDYAIVGARGDDDLGTDSGSAYVPT